MVADSELELLILAVEGPGTPVGRQELRHHRLHVGAEPTDIPSQLPVYRGSEPGGADSTLIATSFDPWPAAGGPAPDLPFLSFTLHDGGQPMELMLAGVDAGRRLSEAGFNMVLGPSLDPSAWKANPELATQASGAFVQGLTASGLIVCADAFPDADLDELTGRLSPFGNAFAHGVEAVRLAPEAADSAAQAEKLCARLRQDLSFRGVIVSEIRSTEAHVCLNAGCDLLVTSRPEETLDELRRAVAEQRVTDERIRQAGTRISELIEAWL